MIIVWVNKRDWKTPGPIVNMALHNAGSFAQLGYDTHLCIGAGDSSNTLTDLETFYGIVPIDNFIIHRVPRYRLFGSTYSVSVFFYAYRLIKDLAKHDSVAVFTRESGFLFFLSRLCKRYENIRGFYELHDLYADLSWVAEKKSGHYREWIYEHLLLPKISGIVCITKAQQKLYKDIFPDIPSCIFPLGTKPMPYNFSSEEKRKHRTLMYVGHIHGDKGVDFLLEAARRLSKENVRIIFWGGKAKMLPHLKKHAEDLGVNSHVKFVAFQPPEQMHRAMALEASLGVVMLRDTYYNRYLTCPVKALDYLSHGIPAVGSDIPSVHEVLSYAGTYVRPDHMDSFIDAVLGLLNNPERYADMSQRSEKRAEEISWQIRAKTLSDFARLTQLNGNKITPN